MQTLRAHLCCRSPVTTLGVGAHLPWDEARTPHPASPPSGFLMDFQPSFSRGSLFSGESQKTQCPLGFRTWPLAEWAASSGPELWTRGTPRCVPPRALRVELQFLFGSRKHCSWLRYSHLFREKSKGKIPPSRPPHGQGLEDKLGGTWTGRSHPSMRVGVKEEGRAFQRGRRTGPAWGTVVVKGY